VLLAFSPFLPSFLPNPHLFCFSGDVEGVKNHHQTNPKNRKNKKKKGVQKQLQNHHQKQNALALQAWKNKKGCKK
jgi:hypothetical protein